MPIDAWLCVGAALWISWKQQRWSPVFIATIMWAAILSAAVINPLSLYPLTAESSRIISIGILATAIGTVVFPVGPAPGAPTKTASPDHARLLTVAVLLSFASVLAYVRFRAQISAAAGGSFSDLSDSAIRSAQTGAAKGGGIGSILVALYPILACVGAYGALRISRLYWFFPLLALSLSMQSPARLSTLSLVLQTGVFSAYVWLAQRALTHRIRIRILAGLVVTVAACMVIFNYVGSRLGKSQLLAQHVPETYIPDWALSLWVYFTGGPFAFSRAIENGNPFDTPGSSAYVPMRIAGLLVDIPKPSSLASFERLPLPFNVFTGYGQMWLDFGTLGVIFLSATFGASCAMAHRSALRGRIPGAWASAVCCSLLFSMPQAFRLFYVDVVFQLVIGYLIFLFIQTSRNVPPRNSTGRRDGSYSNAYMAQRSMPRTEHHFPDQAEKL